ncbi:MAG: methyl-accepting chemotaxis protein, partial [Spirochaetota bacterium]
MNDNNTKFGRLMRRLLIFIAISILFLAVLNISIIIFVNNVNGTETASVTARNVLRIGDRARQQLDKIWNLGYIKENQEYKKQYKTDVLELIPLLIAVDTIEESIEDLTLNPNNSKLPLPDIKFKAIMKNSIHEKFKEPSSEEVKITEHILDMGYGDYRIFNSGYLDFYRPIIINHNRLKERYGAEKGDVIGFYKISIPEERISAQYVYDYKLFIIINSIALIIILIIFYIMIKKKTVQIKRIGGFLKKMTKGDYTGEISLGSNDELDKLSIYINKICYNIRVMGKELNSVAEYMQKSSETFHQFSAELSSSSKKQFIQIQEINESIANLTNEISTSTNIAGEVNTKSQNSLKTAESSNRFVKEVTTDMVEMLKSTKNVEDILKVIKEIAFQTNLLAHNASIEAARAGEQGKGFSVVAQSVSELAKKSSDSTKEIEELIKSSINDLDKGSDKISNLGNNFNSIKNQLSETAELVNNINKILVKQNEESYHVKDSINRINKISQESSTKAQ